jgi:hypothetical protein
MNRNRMILIAGAAALGIVVVAFAMSGSGSATPSRGPQDPTAQREVGQLAGKTDDSSRMALVQRYGEWAGAADKLTAREKILDALLATGDRKGLKSALRAIALDPSPIEDDPMVAYAAGRMQALWKNPELYRYGRDLLLVQSADKTRVALLTSLVPYAASLPAAVDPDRQIKTWMANDLVDLYHQSGDEAKPFIIAGVEQLGAKDVALALVGGNMPHDYAAVQHQADQTEAAMRQMHDQLVDEGDPSLLNPDREKIIDGMTRPH